MDILDLMGPVYIADALHAAADRRARRECFESYSADLLRLLATAWGAENVTRYYDLIHPKPEDDRTAEEIAEDFMRRKGLKFKDPQ